ncbi:isochorismatase family protein [Salinivibrio sp. ML290]|uniref:isochorismatase family protein n=1 Tax=Salinivibrio sp. ML290 TaxID=1909468 RepID=UPI000988611E|nr:isochorismatase family protein [Salinivibrio sp. ML290]OOE74521.1 isochorismatase [Salinivibrio sp. ML290]
MTIPALPTYTMPAVEAFPTNKVSWTFEPAKAAFLIHDMQTYFVSFYERDSALMQTLLDNLVALKYFCKSHGIPVIYTAQPKEQNLADRALLNDMWGPGLNKSPELQQVVEALAPEEGDIVLDKWRYSAFQRSPLEHTLNELGRDQLLIGGIYGHIGCLMTAVDAFMRDIKPFMIGDAIADFSLEEHQMTLKYVAGRAGMVMSTASVIGQVAKAEPHALPDVLTHGGLLARIAKLVDEEEDAFDPDENLIDYGLDSVQIMALITEWRKHGVEINFVQLAETPTFNHWWMLLEQARNQVNMEGQV